MQQKVEGYLSGAKNCTGCDDNTEKEHSTDNPIGDNLEGVTHIGLEAHLRKLQESWNNHLRELFHESDEANEANLKSVEKETDRLLDEQKTWLGQRITNLEGSYTNQKTLINALSENQTQFDEIKENLLTKSNLQPEIQNIVHDLHPADPLAKADFDQLAVNVNQGMTSLQTRMKTAENDITKLQTRMQGIKKKQDKKDLDNLSTANTGPSITKLENTQDKQGELQQAIRLTTNTILEFLYDSKSCKSFQEFSRKLNQTFTRELVEILESRLFPG